MHRLELNSTSLKNAERAADGGSEREESDSPKNPDKGDVGGQRVREIAFRAEASLFESGKTNQSTSQITHSAHLRSYTTHAKDMGCTRNACTYKDGDVDGDSR